MQLLLFSNSTNAGEAYLSYPMPNIKEFLQQFNIQDKILFIPFAAVTFSFDDYFKMVSARFEKYQLSVESIHHKTDILKAIAEAKAIVVGGGNTFKLLKLIQENELIGPIRQKVLAGTPYIGWSAGSNLACPTIRTTNDMPVVELKDGLAAFNLLPFQINPHYLDANPSGHAGETREQRILEFLELNQSTTVVGLREGCALAIKDTSVKLIGNKSLRLFQYGKEPKEYAATDDLSFLCGK
jgi:dipeptidase E